jgi:hypothetical protein
MTDRQRHLRSFKVFLVVVGIVLILTGASMMKQGRIGYSNYWGSTVFPPFAIVGRLLTLSKLER